jgi:ribonuclease-3 family protein
MVVEQANRPASELHKLTTAYVKAEAQARMIVALKEELTEAEAEIFKRGRNAKPYTTAKNATRADYHKATGFEALMGYLYLTRQDERMLELIRRGIELMDGDGR